MKIKEGDKLPNTKVFIIDMNKEYIMPKKIIKLIIIIKILIKLLFILRILFGKKNLNINV